MPDEKLGDEIVDTIKVVVNGITVIQPVDENGVPMSPPAEPNPVAYTSEAKLSPSLLLKGSIVDTTA